MTGRPRSIAPKCTELIKILVTPELDALVTAAAKREGRTVSDWGRRLFEREVAAAHAEPAPRHRKRCPHCNQRVLVVDGALEPHMEPPSPHGGTPKQCIVEAWNSDTVRSSKTATRSRK